MRENVCSHCGESLEGREREVHDGFSFCANECECWWAYRDQKHYEERMSHPKVPKWRQLQFSFATLYYAWLDQFEAAHGRGFFGKCVLAFALAGVVAGAAAYAAVA